MGQERCLVRPGPAGNGGAPTDSQRPLGRFLFTRTERSHQMIPETAIQAATNSIFEDDPRITESDAYDLASNALEAALPHLEAALRKQIAAEQGASAANALLGFI